MPHKKLLFAMASPLTVLNFSKLDFPWTKHIRDIHFYSLRHKDIYGKKYYCFVVSNCVHFLLDFNSFTPGFGSVAFLSFLLRWMTKNTAHSREKRAEEEFINWNNAVFFARTFVGDFSDRHAIVEQENRLLCSPDAIVAHLLLGLVDSFIKILIWF